MLKFKKLSSQIEIYDEVTCIYQDTFTNFLKDFPDSAINFNYDFMLVDPEAFYILTNNADVVSTSVPGIEWQELFNNIQEILYNKQQRDQNKSLLSVLANALATVDAIAGQVRSKVITVAPGQESTYLIKATQAHAFKDAGYTGLVPSMVMAEINATGMSAKATTDSILEQEAQWIAIASTIEEIRRYSKVKIQSAVTIAQVQIELSNAISRFQSLGQ